MRAEPLTQDPTRFVQSPERPLPGPTSPAGAPYYTSAQFSVKLNLVAPAILEGQWNALVGIGFVGDECSRVARQETIHL